MLPEVGGRGIREHLKSSYTRVHVTLTRDTNVEFTVKEESVGAVTIGVETIDLRGERLIYQL